MRLLNQSLKYLSISILIIVSTWSIVFYFNLLDEIYDSIDDGLANYKMLIIEKAEKDTNILKVKSFDEGNYSIQPINKNVALNIRDIYKDSLMFMAYEEDLEPVRILTTAFKQNGKYYKLQIISSMVEEDDLIEDLFWSIFWLYLLLMISIIFINNLLLKKLWAPFYNLVTNLKNFRIDQPSSLPKIKTTTKEFIEIHKAADELLKHASESYLSQKQFTQNASHELQTPLAIITNKLELLIEQNTLSDHDVKKLGEILEITSRVTNLNKSLLLLSKIENQQFNENDSISLNIIIANIISNLDDFSSFKGIIINVNYNSQVSIGMDKTLAEILLLNLITNAIFHNHADGTVEITLDKNQLIICNTAKAKELDANNIFKRFYKSDKIVQSSSTGLGLAIVKAICELYHYNISYHYNQNHYFTLKFNQNTSL